MIKLSTSAMQSYLACPMRFYYAYVLRMQPVDDTDAFRVGNAWHGVQEILDVPDHVYDENQTSAIEQVSLYLDKFYDKLAQFKDAEELMVEKVTLLYMAAGYRWYYDDTDVESVFTEETFELPLLSPKGKEVKRFLLKARIDNGSRYKQSKIPVIRERKTTSKSIEPDSSYWDNLNIALQPMQYIYMLSRQEKYPEFKDCRECMFDVMHKPGISPKFLTQGESKKFVSGKNPVYCDTPFEVEVKESGLILVNGSAATVKPGAKESTFAIKETAEMFGARLLEDIQKTPEKYFARKSIFKTDDQLKEFEDQIYRVGKVMQYMDTLDGWYCNPQQCEATFKCSYRSICFSGRKVTPEMVENDDIPEGFYVYKPSEEVKSEQTNQY